MRPGRVAAALLAAWTLGAVGMACAPRANPGVYAALDARKDDIRELWIQIRGFRVELGMPAEPVRLGEVLLAQAVAALRRCRAPGATADAGPADRCDDACNLRDAICDNADAICRIADELGDDPWATDKCTSAKSSCREATERCCGCTGDAPPAR